jgi:hypothetical protein
MFCLIGAIIRPHIHVLYYWDPKSLQYWSILLTCTVKLKLLGLKWIVYCDQLNWATQLRGCTHQTNAGQVNSVKIEQIKFDMEDTSTSNLNYTINM